MKFYAYLWLRENGVPYYAGKGCGDRAYTSDGHFVKRPQDKNRIIVQAFETEEDALCAEKLLIAIYGRKDLGTGCLRNLTDGGDGCRGYVPTPEVRRKWSAMRKGRIFSPRHLQRLKEAARNRSPEHLAKIAQSLRGKPGTRRGIKCSDETRQRMREATLRIWREKKACLSK